MVEVLAGNINDGGLYITLKPLDELLANELRRFPPVRLALNTFVKFEMIEIEDDLKALSWQKYQSTDRLEELKQKDREKGLREQEKQKIESEESPRMSTLEEDIEEDKEKDSFI